jgi:hypothetical protein
MSEPTTPQQRAEAFFKAQYDAIDAMRDALTRLRDNEGLDPDYVDLRLEALEARETDLSNQLNDLALTGQVTNAPSDDDVKKLTEAVRGLDVHNAARDSIHNIVDQGFVLVGIALDK